MDVVGCCALAEINLIHVSNTPRNSKLLLILIFSPSPGQGRVKPYLCQRNTTSSSGVRVLRWLPMQSSWTSSSSSQWERPETRMWEVKCHRYKINATPELCRTLFVPNGRHISFASTTSTPRTMYEANGGWVGAHEEARREAHQARRRSSGRAKAEAKKQKKCCVHGDN